MSIPLRYISVRGQRSRASITSPVLSGPVSSSTFFSVRCQPFCHISVGHRPLPPPALNPHGSFFSQSSVDVNKHDDEEVQEGANDPQQGQDGLLSLLFTLLLPNLLYTDGGRPHSDPPTSVSRVLICGETGAQHETNNRQDVEASVWRQPEALIQRPNRMLGGAARRVSFTFLLIAQLRV